MKQVYKRIKFLVPILLVLLLNACHSSGDSKENMDETATKAENKTIVISKAQFDISKMKLGKPEKRTFDQAVSVSAYVRTTAEGSSFLSTIIPGIVSNIYVESGDYVKYGSTLFDLSGNEVLQIQQDYLENYYELKALESEYLRQKKLAEENVAAQKTFEAAERDYLVMKTRVQSMKSKLELIQVNPEKLENGNIQKKISIKAPIPGIVSELNISAGQLCEAGETLMTIVNPESFRLELHVFEKDIDKIETGMDVRIKGSNVYVEAGMAKLSKIGKSVQADSRIVNCYAELPAKERPKFLNNQYLEADIITCLREVSSLPDQSLIEEDDRYYVLVLDGREDENYIFRKVNVKVGTIQKGYVELMEEVQGEILVEGAYNLTVE